MLPTYPANDLDRPEKLLGFCGSFWSDAFTGNDLTEAEQYARGQLDAQTVADFDGLLDAMSRQTVRPFRQQLWYRLAFKQSLLIPAGMAVYGDSRDFTYGGNPLIFYGVPPTAADVAFAWGAPFGLAEPGILLNRITDASLTLVPGLDFLYDGVNLVFRTDPFDNDLVSVRDQLDSQGNVIDRVAELWMYGSTFDHDDVYHQFGYAVAHPAANGPGYRSFVNAIYDGLVRGGTADDVAELFAAAADAPVALGSETVVAVFTDVNFLWVVTDQNAYRCGRQATALVAVGDAIQAGQPVCDAVQFFEFGTGTIPDGLDALAIGPGLLANGYLGDLVFRNENVPLFLTTDLMGFTKVSFDIGGFAADVTKFWDDVHAAGLAAGQTLAELLDQRPLASRTTQPTALALPATVNPLGFLCANVLRANAFLCRVKTTSFGPDAVGLTRASQDLRTILPPQTLCITLAELAGDEAPVILDGPGDTDDPGYEESFSSFSGGEPISDVVDDSYFGPESGYTQQM